MATAMAVAGYVRTIMSPLQEAMRIALTLTDHQMAILQGPTIGVPIALSSVPLGALIDRFARVRLLIAFLLVSAIGILLSAAASDFVWLMASRALAGVEALAILPVVFSLLADLFPPEQRGRVTMAAFVGQVMGNAAAFAGGGALLSYFGDARWRDAMLWLAAPVLPVIILTWVVLREPQRRTGERGRTATAWATLAQTWRFIIPVAAGMILLETALGAVLIWGAPMLSRRFALPSDRIGAIMATATVVSGLVGPAIGGSLADLCQRAAGAPRAMAVLAVSAGMTVPACLFVGASTLTSTTVLLVVQMSLITALATMAMASFTLLIPNEMQGLATAMVTALILLFALSCGSVAVSGVMSKLGGAQMLAGALTLVCSAALLAAAVSFGIGNWVLQLRTRTHERNPHFTQC